MIRVTVYNEGLHEKTSDSVRAVYPEGIHGALKKGLESDEISVRTVTLTVKSKTIKTTKDVVQVRATRS